MGIFAIVSTLLKIPGATTALGAVVDDTTRRISKTKVGGAAMLAVAPDWEVLIPAVMSGDPAAIGKLVGIIVAWIIMLWGRGKKG